MQQGEALLGSPMSIPPAFVESEQVAMETDVGPQLARSARGRRLIGHENAESSYKAIHSDSFLPGQITSSRRDPWTYSLR